MNHLLRALDSVDACIFSGDSLEDASNRQELRTHIERWTRALVEREAPDDLSKTDADRMRWILAGNGYFMEENFLCGHEPCSQDEQDKARRAIDEAMRDDQAWDRAAEQFTAKVLGTDQGRINMQAKSIDEIFEEPKPIKSVITPRTLFKCPICNSEYFGPIFKDSLHIGRYCKGWPSGHDRSYIPCRGSHEELFEEPKT